MQTFVAILLIVHGLITAAQSSGSFQPSAGIANPTWLAWWPTGLGQSWVWSGIGIEHSLLARAGGILWLAAGAALVAAGLGLLGVLIPTNLWRSLALAGAGLSLVMLLVYLHPFYGIGILSSALLLAALLSTRWTVLHF